MCQAQECVRGAELVRVCFGAFGLVWLKEAVKVNTMKMTVETSPSGRRRTTPGRAPRLPFDIGVST